MSTLANEESPEAIQKEKIVRLTFGKHTSVKEVSRQKKKARIRSKLAGSTERPRLCIFRSSKHIYAQVIDDVTGKTLVAASTLDTDGLKNANKETASAIGKEIAKLTKLD